MPRFFCPGPLTTDATLQLPPRAARHVQVLRLQPGDEVTLFDGSGGEWSAQVLRMGRQDVDVRVADWRDVDREASRAIHLAVGMPANERMDWLVEKATELGAASIIPVQLSRSVVRLSGERADKKRHHWQAIAEAACEQCGRNRVPEIAAVVDLEHLVAWPADTRVVLSTAPGAQPLSSSPVDGSLLALSGPEGGLSEAELAQVLDAGFAPVTLGPRVLRAETAPLAVLARLANAS